MDSLGTTLYAVTRSANTDKRGKDSIFCKFSFDSTWSTIISTESQIVSLNSGGGDYPSENNVILSMKVI